MSQQDYPPEKTQEEIEAEQELARLKTEEAAINEALNTVLEHGTEEENESFKIYNDLETPEGRVAIARAKYIPEYLRTKKELSKLNNLRRKLFGNENHFQELSLNSDVNITSTYLRLKKEYDQARVELGRDMYEKKQTELINNPALTREQITAELNQYRDSVIRYKTIVDERQLLVNAHAEGIPVDPGKLKKLADWYVKQGKWKKLAISTGVFTAAAAAGSALGIIGSVGGVAGLATMAGARFGKGLLSGTVSGLTTSGIGLGIEKLGFNTRFERKQAIALEEINKKFADGTMGQVEYEEKLDELEAKKKNRERNQARFKMGIGILVAGISSYEVAHHDVAGQLTRGLGITDPTPESMGLGHGHIPRPDEIKYRLEHPTDANVSPQELKNLKTYAERHHIAYDHDAEAHRAQELDKQRHVQEQERIRKEHEAQETAKAEKLKADQAEKDKLAAEAKKAQEAAKGKESTTPPAEEKPVPPPKAADTTPAAKTDTPQETRPITKPASNPEPTLPKSVAPKPLESSAHASTATEQHTFKLPVMPDEAPSLEIGDLKAGQTIDIAGTDMFGSPAVFKITDMDQLKYAIEHHNISGIQLSDENVLKLKEVYDHQLNIPDELPPMRVGPAHPLEQVHAPEAAPTQFKTFPTPEHHDITVDHNHFNTIDEVKIKFGEHNIIAEAPDAHGIHGMSYQDWNHHTAEFLKQHSDVKVTPESTELNRLFATVETTPQGAYLDTTYYLGRPHWDDISHMPAKDLMHFKASDFADMEKHDPQTLQRLMNNGLVKPLGNHRFEFTYENHELERLQHIMKKVDPGHWRPYTTPRPESVEEYIKRAVNQMKINETEDGTLWVIKDGRLTQISPQPGQYLGQNYGYGAAPRIAPAYNQYNTGGIAPLAPRYGVYNEGYEPTGYRGPRFTREVPWSDQEVREGYEYGGYGAVGQAASRLTEELVRRGILGKW